MYRAPIKLPKDIEFVTQDEHPGVTVTMSDSIYFGGYPYKVEFIPQEFDNKRSLKYFRRDIEDFVEDFEITQYRSYISKNKQHMFFRSKSDMQAFVGMYHEQIKKIYAPVSQKHLDFLLAEKLTILVRSNLYYGKYDAKVSCYNSRSRTYNFYANYSSYRHMAARIPEKIEEIRDFLQDNAKNFKFVGSAPYCTNFFCDYNELQELMPFMVLYLDDIDLHITKILSDDK